MENCKKENLELLDKMYKNVKMGADSMVNIMDKVRDDGIRRELTAELDEYESYSNEVSKMIYDCGGKPKEENVVTKLGFATEEIYLMHLEKAKSTTTK